MGRSIGVLAARHIWVGVVEGNAITGPVRMYPEPGLEEFDPRSVPADEFVEKIRELIVAAAGGLEVDSIGAGFPGIVRGGLIQESPNLGQLKGLAIEERLSAALKADGVSARVVALNDADALAAGIAATRGQLEKTIRVWYLGDGIGFGRYPRGDGIWEGGHSVVSLDPKERYCGCGGEGHLEGFMGERAMRLRFLDLEPEEVFAGARHGDQRCEDFVRLWHRALAAATATSVHQSGPGRFYLAGPNAEYVDCSLLGSYMQDMVKMSPLQGSFFEIVPPSHDLALIGAAVSSGVGVA